MFNPPCALYFCFHFFLWGLRTSQSKIIELEPKCKFFNKLFLFCFFLGSIEKTKKESCCEFWFKFFLFILL